MRTIFLAAGLVVAAVAAVPPLARETREEAALNVRNLVQDVSIGTMSSLFPSDSPNAGHPFAIMEYHAPCHSGGSLTFSLMPISLSTHNILSDPAHRVTYTVSMPNDNARSAMSRARVSFIGNITVLDYDEIPAEERARLTECYQKYHPDAWWTPMHKQKLPHESFWARLDIEDIYYVGGFGDTHYIGHIPLDMYDRARDKGHDRFVVQL